MNIVRKSRETQIIQGDCLDVMRGMDTDSVDLVLCSPPHEDARTYGIGFAFSGQQWVDWAFARFVESVRVCRGLVAWVVEGRTRNFRYSATRMLLMADLVRAGINLRKPAVYRRVGIPGSGGKEWWRNDWEPFICATKGRLPWSDNTAIGRPPKFPPGGRFSNRTKSGSRANARHPWRKNDDGIRGEKRGGAPRYQPPSKANPGNVIECHVGGGKMGSDLAHENEAPFPEKLAEAFVLSFCPPNGVVLDCFCGSGTVLAVAAKHGRRSIGIDVRESQVALSQRRIAEV